MRRKKESNIFNIVLNFTESKGVCLKQITFLLYHLDCDEKTFFRQGAIFGNKQCFYDSYLYSQVCLGVFGKRFKWNVPQLFRFPGTCGHY